MRRTLIMSKLVSCNHSRLSSGCHPFDCEAMFQPSEDWLEGSCDLESSQFSQRYFRNEAELKRRIIDGKVDFRQDPWSLLPDGT